MSIDCKPCQDGTVILGSTLFEGNACPLSSSAADNRSSWEYLPHAQAKPPGQDTKSQAHTYVTGLHFYILLELLTSGHLSSWQYLPQGTRLHTSADRVAREHGHPIRHLPRQANGRKGLT
ncbi:hypothetical protein DPMN_042623 [Dreissena polymorpha]|uniref:Uncharacterized protein n=1 Tax=Dreissena polymorpha TaxID=45954 RepID=A0A9D4CYY4_DREPO|nr:hypothetical protein DPMN_042623 [Dreissena polymorpha]